MTVTISASVLDPWWMAALAAVGVLALATAVVSLFFALGRRPGKLFAILRPTLNDEDAFLMALTGATNAPTRAGGRAEVLSNGDEFFPAMLEAIRGARQSITFFTYIYEDGKIGRQFLEALTTRARAGVEVRLLLDGFGGMSADQQGLDALQRAGGKYHYYRPLRFGKLTRIHRRNHRRAIVIDGRVGFTGGASIGDKWLGDAQTPDHWRDDMFGVTGPLALSLQAAFGEAWSNTHGEVLAGPAFFPHDRSEEDPGGEGVDISRHVNLISSPSDEAHSIRKMFWLSFMAAQKRLYLTHAYFVPDSHMRMALVDRARAGVDVRVLTANHHTDVKPVWYAGRSHYEQLLEAGVRIYEYQPTFVHSKNIVADGKWSVVGSANMSIRSKELNEENVLGILDHDFGAELERTFFDDLEHAREIRLEEWRRRGAGTRLLERFCALFEEQY
jgi:cardiolipin synthase A/B